MAPLLVSGVVDVNAGVAVPDVAVVVDVAVDGAITVGVDVCVAVAVPIVGVVGTSAWGLSGLPHIWLLSVMFQQRQNPAGGRLQDHAAGSCQIGCRITGIG